MSLNLVEELDRLKSRLDRERAFSFVPHEIADRLYEIAVRALDQLADPEQGNPELRDADGRPWPNKDTPIVPAPVDPSWTPLTGAFTYNRHDTDALQRIEAMITAAFPGHFEGGGKWRKLTYVLDARPKNLAREAGIEPNHDGQYTLAGVDPMILKRRAEPSERRSDQ